MTARKTVTILTIVLGLLVAAAPAIAMHVRGNGRLVAWGEGTVRVEGSGTFYLRGAGTLMITDRDPDVDIEIHGFRYSRKTVNGLRVYRGAGWVRVTAPDTMLELAGDIESFAACGVGVCHLSGEGSFSVDGKTKPWPAAGLPIRFELEG